MRRLTTQHFYICCNKNKHYTHTEYISFVSVSVLPPKDIRCQSFGKNVVETKNTGKKIIINTIIQNKLVLLFNLKLLRGGSTNCAINITKHSITSKKKKKTTDG